MTAFQKLLISLTAASLLSGCGSFKVPAYSPHYETLDQMKKQMIEPMAVREIKPSDPNAAVNRITLRGSSLTPSRGTFATYLEDALRSDLKEMNLYDEKSNIIIDATILKNDIDISGFGVGYGVMEISLTVHRFGALIFGRNYVAKTQFSSSFAGAVAIPKGQSEYPNLVRALLQKIYKDSAFINAVKK